MIQLWRLMVLAAVAAVVLQMSCKDSGTGPVDYLPENLALYVSLDGGSNNAGLWVLDANTLQLVDSLGTGQGVPWTVEFSPNYEIAYSIWREYPSNQEFLHSIETRSMAVISKALISPPIPFLGADRKKNMLIAYGSTSTRFYNREELSLLRDDTTLAVWQMESSKLESKVYMTRNLNRVFAGIQTLDLDAFELGRIIPVADSLRQRRMQPVSLAISPDDRFAFLSAFNWRGGGGYNSFIVVELSTGTVIGEHECGAFAQLGVSPDGRYVYITDPAGYLYQMPFTNQILRYNVNSRSMEVFVSLSDLELGDTVFKPDKILVAPDNRTIYVSLWAAGSKNREGKRVQLLKIDAHTRKIIGTFSLPLDENGNVTQHIRNVRFGYRPK
jgi:hypothetical protein